MQNRWIFPVVVMAISGWAGFAVGNRQSTVSDAQALLRALRANELPYKSALDAEARSVQQAERLLATGNRPAVTRAAEELAGTGQQLRDLTERLQAIRLKPTVKRQYLEPILRQLAREERNIREVRELVLSGREDDLAEAVRRLERHQHPMNLVGETIRDIRSAYGLGKPRMWHGRPLTA